MLIDAHRSMLLVIDMQEKVLPAIHDHERVTENVVWLMRAAQKLGVPVAATEHYAKGLGPTVAAVKSLLPAEAIGAKNHFSAVAAQCLTGLPGGDRAQAVLAGIETHVCLLQTGLELLEEGKEVFVVGDCVGSRSVIDRDLALARLKQDGARIVSREMVVYEWLEEAGTPLFREMNRDFLR